MEIVYDCVIFLQAENVEEDETDEAQAELVATIAQQAAASSSGEQKRRRKDAHGVRGHMARAHVTAPNDEPDEALEHALWLTTR